MVKGVAQRLARQTRQSYLVVEKDSIKVESVPGQPVPFSPPSSSHREGSAVFEKYDTVNNSWSRLAESGILSNPHTYSYII